MVVIGSYRRSKLMSVPLHHAATSGSSIYDGLLEKTWGVP